MANPACPGKRAVQANKAAEMSARPSTCLTGRLRVHVYIMAVSPCQVEPTIEFEGALETSNVPFALIARSRLARASCRRRPPRELKRRSAPFTSRRR